MCVGSKMYPHTKKNTFIYLLTTFLNHLFVKHVKIGTDQLPASCGRAAAQESSLPCSSMRSSFSIWFVFYSLLFLFAFFFQLSFRSEIKRRLRNCLNVQLLLLECSSRRRDASVAAAWCDFSACRIWWWLVRVRRQLAKDVSLERVQPYFVKVDVVKLS